MKPAGHAAAVLLAVLLLVGCGAVAGGKPGRPTAKLAPSAGVSPRRVRFSTIHMDTARVGWATAGTVVYRTTDSGSHWTRVFAAPSSASASSTEVASSYPTSNVGVVAVATSDGSTLRASVYETTDGGQRWIAHRVDIPSRVGGAVAGGMVQVQFVSASRGWLLLVSPDNAGSTEGALLATSDEGTSWNLLQRPSVTGPSVFEDVTAVAFAKSGWGIATENTVVFDRAEVLVTRNGGITWSSVRLALPSAALQTEAAEGMPSLGSGGVALIPVTYDVTPKTQDLLVYATTNQGTSFTSTASPWPHPLPLGTLTAPVYPLLPDNFLVVGGRWLLVPTGRSTEEYALTVTHAAGPRWHLVSRIPMSVATAASILPGGPGWVVSMTEMYETSGAGRTWSPWRVTLAP